MLLEIIIFLAGAVIAVPLFQRFGLGAVLGYLAAGVLIGPAPYSAPAAYYFPRPARIAAVEVAKGPAAIKYGPMTVGGALNLFSTPIPDVAAGTLAGKAELLIGNHDGRRVHGWAGGWA